MSEPTIYNPATALATVAPDGRLAYLARGSDPERPAGVWDWRRAATWPTTDALLAWADALPLAAQAALQVRRARVVKVPPEYGGPAPRLRFECPDFDRAWSPTLDPIVPEMCRGKAKAYAAPKAPRAAQAAPAARLLPDDQEAA
jgi:hypothetical protein